MSPSTAIAKLLTSNEDMLDPIKGHIEKHFRQLHKQPPFLVSHSPSVLPSLVPRLLFHLYLCGGTTNTNGKGGLGMRP